MDALQAMIAVGALGLAVAPGCSSGGSGPNGNPVVSLPLEQANAAFAAVICGKFFACCDADELAGAEVGTSEAACSAGLFSDGNGVFDENAPGVGSCSNTGVAAGVCGSPAACNGI